MPGFHAPLQAVFHAPVGIQHKHRGICHDAVAFGNFRTFAVFHVDFDVDARGIKQVTHRFADKHLLAHHLAGTAPRGVAVQEYILAFRFGFCQRFFQRKLLKNDATLHAGFQHGGFVFCCRVFIHLRYPSVQVSQNLFTFGFSLVNQGEERFVNHARHAGIHSRDACSHRVQKGHDLSGIAQGCHVAQAKHIVVCRDTCFLQCRFNACQLFCRDGLSAGGGKQQCHLVHLGNGIVHVFQADRCHKVSLVVNQVIQGSGVVASHPLGKNRPVLFFRPFSRFQHPEIFFGDLLVSIALVGNPQDI